MIFEVLLIILFSFLVSSVVMSWLIKKIKISQGSVPHVGGMAIWFSFTVLSILFLVFKVTSSVFLKNLFVILLGSTVMFFVGVIDDKKELSVLRKFIAQLLIICITILLGIRTDIVRLGIVGNSIVTMLWILGITNAFNHLDILDGLSAGIAFLSALAFCVVSLLTGNGELAFIFALLAGAVFGFLIYNFPTARVFMGNAGSHFLGFILSTLAIMISYATLEKKVALFIPLIILGVPIFDTLFVVCMRILKRKHIWVKSNDHLALRLIAKGYSKAKAVVCMFVLALIFSLCAIVLLRVSVQQCYIIITLLALLCFVIAIQMQKIVVKE